MSLAPSFDVISSGGCGRNSGTVGAARLAPRHYSSSSGPFLGGAATLKNVLTYCWSFYELPEEAGCFGVADQVLQRLP